jgi:hypothetical protein
MLLIASLLAACAHTAGGSTVGNRPPTWTGSPSYSPGPVDHPTPAAPQAGDIVLTDADGQPLSDHPPTIIAEVGQTIAVVLTVDYDTTRGVFVSGWTLGASAPFPSSSTHEVNVPPLTALGGNRFQATAIGRATLAAQVAHGMDLAPLKWRATIAVEP